MEWTSIVAIYALIWVLSAFLVLPFGMRTHEEEGLDLVPGQADSAPAQFRPGRILLRATVLAAFLFGVFYLNYANDWIDRDDLIGMYGEPPSEEQ